MCSVHYIVHRGVGQRDWVKVAYLFHKETVSVRLWFPLQFMGRLTPQDLLRKQIDEGMESFPICNISSTVELLTVTERTAVQLCYAAQIHIEDFIMHIMCLRDTNSQMIGATTEKANRILVRESCDYSDN